MNIRSVIWKTFSVQYREIRSVVPLFLLYFLSGSFYTIGQIYTETMFLKSYGAQGLSRFFMYNGGALIIAGILYNFFLARISLGRGYHILIALAVISIYGADFFAGGNAAWLPFALFLANYLITFFFDVHFFNYSFQFLNLRSSKRILPLVMGGGKLGGIFASLLVMLSLIGITDIGVHAWAINGALLVIPVWALGRIARKGDSRTPVRYEELLPDLQIVQKIRRKFSIALSSRIFMYSAAAVFIMSVANQVAEYFFAREFNRAFTSPRELASFLAAYTIVADVLTLLVQIFVASRIIRKVGVQRANMIYPLSFLGLAACLGILPGMVSGILLRFFRKNLSVIFRIPAFNTIMAASPRDRMAEMKSFIGGIVSPLGMIAGGILIHGMAHTLVPWAVFWVSVSVGLAYAGITLLQNRAYVGALKNNLAIGFFNRREVWGDFFQQQEAEQNLSAGIDRTTRELLFNEHPALSFVADYADQFPEFAVKTREHMIELAATAGIELQRRVLVSAVADPELYIRGIALAHIKNLAPADRSAVLARYAGDRSDIERDAIGVLLAGQRTAAAANAMIGPLFEKYRNQYRDKKIGTQEFLLFIQSLPDTWYCPALFDLAMATGNIVHLKRLVPVSRLLTRRQMLDLLRAFPYAPAGVMVDLVAGSGQLDAVERLLLLDRRNPPTPELMDTLYQRDERCGRMIIRRLFRGLSYKKKTQYLNYLLALNFRPDRESGEYINYEIIRILEALEVKNSLAAYEKSVPEHHARVLRFIDLLCKAEIEARKRLVLKAIALRTGMQIDEAYETNILLRDSDLNNYILEYIESSGKKTRQALFIFEEDSAVSEFIILPPEIFDRRLREYLHAVRCFIPELAGCVDFCRRFLYALEDSRSSPGARGVAGELSAEDTEMLSIIEKMLILKKNSLFADLSVEELVYIGRITREIEIPADSVVLREGEPGDELFIIVEGLVSVYTHERPLAELGAGACFGELSIIDKEPRSASVKTIRATRFLSVSRRDFLLTLSENPLLSIRIMQMMAQRLRQMI